MSFSLTVNGSSFLKNLLNTYNWQKESLQGVEGGAFLPALNILYAGVFHPPVNIFSRFLEAARPDPVGISQNIERFARDKTAYNNSGLLERLAWRDSSLTSLWIGEAKDEMPPGGNDRLIQTQLPVVYQINGQLVRMSAQPFANLDCRESSTARPASAGGYEALASGARGLAFDIVVN